MFPRKEPDVLKQGAKPHGHVARVVAVSGGRGAVGKSVVAANLSWALAQTGRRVAVIDLDFESPSQHALLGIPYGRPGLATLLDEREPVHAALSETRHPNLRLVVGASSGVPPSAVPKLIERARGLQVDVVVLDVGVAAGWDASSLFELGDQRIAVATPQGSSVQDTYALFNAAVLRVVRAHLARTQQLGLFESPRAKDLEKIAALLDRVRARDPALAEEITESLERFGAFLVGVEVQESTQVGVFQALAKMASDYLGITVPLLGWLRVNARLPDLGGLKAAVSAGNSDEARAFRRMAEALAEAHPPLPLPSEDVALELEPEEVDPTPRRKSHITPPPIPVPRAPEPKGSKAVAPSGPIKPRVHVPPPRKGRPREPKSWSAGSEKTESGKRRKKTLPGMPPARIVK
jgi:MinD-like ATPase involved in chromosome partitioning or flagellar assembly